MDTLVVTRIERIAGDSDSAEVTLTSDKGEIVAFCHPCELSEGQVIPNMLHGMAEMARAAYLSDWPDDTKGQLAIERLERVGPLGYRGCGLVTDQSLGLLEVLGFKLNLGDFLPCNGPVEFECSRIDVWP